MKSIPLSALIKDIETIAPKINSIKEDDSVKIHIPLGIDMQAMRGRGTIRKRRSKKPTA